MTIVQVPIRLGARAAGVLRPLRGEKAVPVTREAKLMLGCLALALLVPLGKLDKGAGEYANGVLRMLIAGGVVVAVAPRIENAMKKRKGEQAGQAGQGVA